MKGEVFGVCVAALLLCLCSADALACSCMVYSVRHNFRHSDAVFVGKVVEVTPLEPTDDFPLAASLVRFEVERRWKGARGREVTAVADVGMAGCAPLSLSVGESFLIFAPREKGRLHVTTWCGPSMKVGNAAEEMKRLDSFWLRASARLYPYPKLF
jgi:hypothetical protein